MKIAIGSDHAGWKKKEDLKNYLHQKRHLVADYGTFSEVPVDYPDIALKVAQAVRRNRFMRGILLCGSGLGMCIAANKVKGIRAANCYNRLTAKLSREHNDSNILCLGARLLSLKQIKDITNVWLTTDFSAPPERIRHQRRIAKIKKIENNNNL